MTTNALVPTGIVTFCCGSHRPAGCCDPEDCAPCCAECPTCPLYDGWTPEERKVSAARFREYLAELLDIQRAADRAWQQHREGVVNGGSTPIYAETIDDTGIIPNPAALLWPAIEFDRPPFNARPRPRNGT